jgi:hypothetical protein
VRQWSSVIWRVDVAVQTSPKDGCLSKGEIQ